MSLDSTWGGEEFDEEYCKYCGMDKEEGHRDRCFFKSGFPEKGEYIGSGLEATGDKKEDLENSRRVFLSIIEPNKEKIGFLGLDDEKIASRLVYEDLKHQLAKIILKTKEEDGPFSFWKNWRNKKKAKKSLDTSIEFYNSWKKDLGENRYMKKAKRKIDRTKKML